MFYEETTDVNVGTPDQAAELTGAEPEADYDPFIAIFNDDGEEIDENGNDDSNATTTDADQQKDEEQTESKPDEATEYTIKYKGKEQTVKRTQAELIADIQKAMDYDAVKAERDSLKTASADNAGALEIVDFYADQNGMTRAEYIAFCREHAGLGSEDAMLAAVKKEFDGISDAAAKEIAASRLAKQQSAKAAEEDGKLQSQLDELTAEYPDVKNVDDLPDDVKKGIAAGKSPIEAMRAHELKTLRAERESLRTEIAALRKEKDNHFRSTGRAESKTSGVAADPFITGFLGGG